MNKKLYTIRGLILYGNTLYSKIHVMINQSAWREDQGVLKIKKELTPFCNEGIFYTNKATNVFNISKGESLCINTECNYIKVNGVIVNDRELKRKIKRKFKKHYASRLQTLENIINYLKREEQSKILYFD